MGNSIREEIGLRIAKLRESRNLSQAQLALELEKIGLKVRRETVTQWENGTRDLKTEYTMKLAEFFGVSCDYILRGVEAEQLHLYKDLGLTGKTVDVLKQMWSGAGENSANRFITNKCFALLLRRWGGYIATSYLHLKEKEEFCNLVGIDESKLSDDDCLILADKCIRENAYRTDKNADLIRVAESVIMRTDRKEYCIYKLHKAIDAMAEACTLAQKGEQDG